MYAFVLGIIGGAAAGTDKSLSLKESMLSRKVLVHNQTSCPCKDPSLCNPIKTRAKKEVRLVRSIKINYVISELVLIIKIQIFYSTL